MYNIAVMLYIVGSAVALAHFNHLRIFHIGLCNLLNLKRKGSGEQQNTLLLRNALQNGIKILLETHVQHLISLIQDKCMHTSKVYSLSPDKVQQSARSGNNNVRNLFQCLNLGLNSRTAIHIHYAEIRQVF